MGSPFSVITGALVTALGLPLDRSAEERRRAITEHVARVVAAEDAPRVSLFLAEILGAARADEGDVRIQAARRDPELMADQVRLAVVDFTTAWCAKNPLVIVLEDLQWADAPSVRAIDQLLATARDLPLLVVGVARPEVFDRFPDLWARRVPQEIKVGALPRRAAEELVRSALGADTAPDVIERLIGASQGNAFFLEELVRAEAAGRGEETPPTVLAVVRARLEAMEPEARRVMRAASIFGRRFFSAGVAALVGRDVRDAIARLEEQEVLSRRAEASAPGEPDFAFRHDLMRDAAYAMLTSDDRTLGHRLAAKWLAGRPGVPAVVLAEHFELGGMRERAAPLWARAAADALDGNDLEECLHSAGQVFEPALSFEQRGQLALVRAEALIWRGDHAGAEGQAKEAIRLLPQGSDAWCQAMTELVTARSRHGASAVSDVAEELLAATEEGTPSVAVSGMLARLALTLRHGGLPALATRVAVRVRQAASGHADPTVEGWLHRLAASEALFEGDLGTYLAEERAARDCFTAIGATRRSVLSTVNVGYALLELGAYRDAERALREAVEVTTRTGLGQLATVAQQNLGRALAANGRLREAVELERTTARAAADAGDVRLEGGSLLYLAQIHLELGELEDAEEAARSAVERLSALPTLAPYGGAVLARVMLARGRADDALELTRRAVEGLDEVGELEEGETLVLLVRAEALAEAGRIEEASEAIARAKAVVQARASRIRDPELRRSFLEKVADNARVTEM